MSDVKYSKRKKSRLEAQHMAYAIRKRITVELMASFALSQKRIEAYVESATKGIADISEREVTAKLLRELTMDRNVWFITKERDTVLDLCQGISRQLRMEIQSFRNIIRNLSKGDFNWIERWNIAMHCRMNYSLLLKRYLAIRTSI